MTFYFVKNSIITRITSKYSKNFYFMVYGCENITFDGVKVTAPADCVSFGDGSRKLLVQNVNSGSDTDNGVRIKTWLFGQGTLTITDIRFEDITMSSVRNPIIIDHEYCPWNQCNKMNPSKIKIRKDIFKNIKVTTKAEEGVVLICSSGVLCDGVELSNIDLKFNGKPAKAVCSNVKPNVSGNAPKCEAYYPPPSG
ncbi:unnamed protein product [Vicia faba]|uniref:Polygalacturonase n=1 Tax=Vicia faba TaxID=3906 RepID=A0AAV0YYH8_VICFA|nr:unnamed protein product [Vicia faba]